MAQYTVANIAHRFHVGDGMSMAFSPLEALYVAEAIESAGAEVDFRDLLLAAIDAKDSMDPEFFANTFLKDAADTVILICTNESLPVAVLGARRFKQEHPTKRVLLGGVGGAGISHQLLKSFPEIDLVVVGSEGTDGESASPETYADLVRQQNPDYAKVPGLVYREQGTIVTSTSRPPRGDIGTIPLPAYHFADLSRYEEVMMRASWGCPFRCAYCDRHREGLMSVRSMDNVMEEIKLLADTFNRHSLFLYDETFTYNRKRVMEFCRRIRELNVDMKWSCTGRADTVDEEMLKVMADSGCQAIYYGLESGSDTILKHLKGGLTRDQARRAMEASLKYTNAGAFFIWGFPFESMDDARSTLEFAHEIETMGAGITMYSFSAWPQCALYREHKDALIFHREWWEANWPRHLENAQSRELVANLIRDHRDVFPGFHSADPLILEKLAMVQEMGFESHFGD